MKIEFELTKGSNRVDPTVSDIDHLIRVIDECKSEDRNAVRAVLGILHTVKAQVMG